ncbi:MAG: hypothetical protein U0231_12700 [Nitrospiraceae bacterium]
MDTGKPTEAGTPLQPFVREGTDPEVVSVKQLLKLLDKAAKSARTYGATNPVAQRFFQQFYDDLTKHLESYARLAFLIQRNQLLFKDEIVYQPDSDATGDSIAFKMYSDGIRELTFHQGLSQADLSFFLDALWGALVGEAAAEGEPSTLDEDDDIVTRLWSKSLDTIIPGTAEERRVRSSGFGVDVLELQTNGYMTMSVTSLRDLLDRERAMLARSEKRGDKAGGTDRAGETDAGRRIPVRPGTSNARRSRPAWSGMKSPTKSWMPWRPKRRGAVAIPRCISYYRSTSSSA